MRDDELLDRLQRGAFGYFVDATNPDNGLVADTSRDGSPAAGTGFPHIESAAGRIVVANALQGGRERLSAEIIPWCTFTDPEIAHVGMYVTEARTSR